MLRSEEMTLTQIIGTGDKMDALALITDLGKSWPGFTGLQFRDLNGDTPKYKRTFADELKRCDEPSRYLNYLASQVEAAGFPEPNLFGAPWVEFEDASIAIARARDELKESGTELNLQTQEVNRLKEHIHVLKLGGQLFGDDIPALPTPTSPSDATPLAEPLLGAAFPTGKGPAEHALYLRAGTVERSVEHAFHRAVYRVSRGNCVYHSLPIEEPLLAVPKDARGTEQVMVPKNVVMLFYSSSTLDDKIHKLCATFGVTLFAYPQLKRKRQALHAQRESERAEMLRLLRLRRSNRKWELQQVALMLASWILAVEREKITRHTLNLLLVDNTHFTAEGWVTTSELPALRQVLISATAARGGAIAPVVKTFETDENPPTLLRTNKFTAGFQALVNTYGVPRYREVNPGAFAIILFPFLFGIMFGDVGHGALLVLLAAAFIANEKTLGRQKLDDIIGMAYGGRYVLLLNGLFAMYIGFLYNEIFSVPMGLFKSSWQVIESGDDDAHRGPPEVVWDGTVYPFGVDPMWQKAANKMTFFNSFKMKLSIIFGVAQMMLGICLQLPNHIRTGDGRSIKYGFIPEITFFVFIFGYLVFMILKKWSIDWVGEAKRPPSLLNTLIAMFMSPGVYTEEDRLYEGQEDVQLVFVLIAVVAVPFLLIPKPLLAYLDLKKAQAAKAHDEETASAQPPAPLTLGNLLASASQLVGVAIQMVVSIPQMVIQLVSSVTAAVNSIIAFVQGIISGGGGASSSVAPLEHADEGARLAEADPPSEPSEPVAAGKEGEGEAAGGEGEAEEEEEEEGELGEIVVHQVIHTIEFVLGAISNTASYLRLWALSLAHSQLSELFFDKVMENLSSFLHALRLQWVEFQNKFYNGDGYMFKPFSYATLGANDDSD